MEEGIPTVVSVRMGSLPSRSGYQLQVMKAFHWPLLGMMHNKYLTITLVKKKGFNFITMITNPKRHKLSGA